MTALTWASRSFLGDRVLSARWPLDEKIKKLDRKLWVRRSLTSCVSCQESVLKSTGSYILFPGEKRQSQQEANQCCPRGTGYLKNITGTQWPWTDNHSPLGGKSWVQELKPQIPHSPGPRALLSQPSICSFSVRQGLRKSLGQYSPQQGYAEKSCIKKQNKQQTNLV